MPHSKYKINPHTNQLDRVLSDSELEGLISILGPVKDAVDTFGDLPVTGNTEGDIRVIKDTDDMYVWGIPSSSGTLADWKFIGNTTSLAWGNISGDIADQTDLQAELDDKTDETDFTNHTGNTSNPHSVTKAQVGLANVDNTSDINKPISTATQNALDLKADKVSAAVDAFTKLLLHLNGTDGATTSNDDSAFVHAISFFNGAQLDTAEFKFGTSSLLLDGSNDYISSPDDADWNFSTGDFTLDTWVRFNALPVSTDRATLFSHYKGSTPAIHSGGWLLSLYNDLGTYKLRLQTGTSYPNFDVFDRNWTPLTNTWYHVEVSRSSGVLYMFVDGTLLGSSGAYTADMSGASGVRLIVGAFDNDPTPGGFVNGWIDEARVSKGIGRHTSNFSVATQQYGGTTVGYLTGGGNLQQSNIPTQDLEDAIANSHTHSNQVDLDNVSGTNTGDQDASEVPFTAPTGSNLVSTNVEDALAELETLIAGQEEPLAENVDVDAGIEVVDSFADTLCDAVVWHYVVINGSNRRAGTIVAVWDPTLNTIEFTETSTQDIGDTSLLTFEVAIVSNNVELQAVLGTGETNYTVRARREII